MADPEIPEAAIIAAAEAMRRYDAEFDPARGRHWWAEAREVLAAALPHLDGDALVKLAHVRKVRDELANWRKIVIDTSGQHCLGVAVKRLDKALDGAE